MAEELYTTFDRTLYRQGSPLYSGDGTPLTNISNIAPSTIGDGFSPGNTEMVQGALQSGAFETGVQGWQIDAEGNAEFNTGTFRGQLIAGSIDIPDTTSANSFHTDNMGNSWWGATTFAAAPASISKTGAAVFSSATIAGYTQTNIGTFGGNGSDGALTISSGTTTISLGSASTVVKNYTSISITGTGALAFSNPASTGTIIILKSQGGITLTSSTIPNIDASGMGAAGGTGGAPANDGVNGTEGLSIFDASVHGGGKGIYDPPGASTAGVVYTNTALYTVIAYTLTRKSIFLACGSGGGGGAGTQNVGTPATGAAGGRGGGVLVIECAGALNFTSALGISVAGLVGATSTNGEGAGGGGTTGMAVVLYNTLTAASGTINTAGGAGGPATGNNTTVNQGGGGGAGGGSVYAAGGAGGKGGTNVTGPNAGSNAAGAGAGGGGAGGKVANQGSTQIGGTGGASTNVLTTQNLYFS